MTYLEAIEDDARCNFQFDQTGGSGRCFYQTPVGSGYDPQAVVLDILGYTNPFASGNPNLTRVIPATHPKCPYLYAHRISSLLGKGSGTAVQVIPTPPSNPAIGSAPIANYLQYLQYEVGVEFSSRPYPVIPDDAFTTSKTGAWFVKTGGAKNTFTYSPEWVRYCDYDYYPQDNVVQGQQGGFYLVKDGGTNNFVLFANPPWMWLPDKLLKVRWYQVPYRYITSSNSYIAGGPNRNWRGRINQNNWWNWPAGSLLYMGYEVKKYSPPFNDTGTYPTYLPIDGSLSNTGTVVGYERLCDIELTFLYTQRYMSGSLGASLTNGNYVAAGHNLLPSVPDNAFYYATRNTTATGNVQNAPPWYSFPAEVLFTDPDAGTGPTTTGDN